MSGIHLQVSRPAVGPGPHELGRVDWLVLGSAALVAGAAVHALSGVVAITKDLVHAAPAPDAELPAPAAKLTVDERDGWILITALFVVTGAVAHSVARIVESARTLVHPAHLLVRP
ncbi:hypothetical protein BX285_6482 [Streptomyces sp. 1114.5]|uniref:hypothetical protein n=1 Tax=unclassified Streptomyces TaxID=2593676 RepID=UPI000BD710F6|nr:MULTISPECIES: hypothetical protein [unclassified Streptomyces]RKT09389.1 hypothetical protein BX285_6482 [Streptomyces sp. 1114.5]SOB88605.1 hypothetical protein SAMN06272789_6894 [Streptomyces sp. 1331.2]